MRSPSRTPSRRSNRGTNTRDKNRRRQHRIGLALLGLSAIVAGAFLFFYVTAEKKKIVKETNCPAAGIFTYTAVIIDTTDKINAIQNIAIQNELNQIKASIPRYGALGIYSAGFTGQVSRPRFEMCNPGSPADINRLTEGERLALKRWRDGFSKPLDTILQKMLVISESSSTPLFEAIQSVSVQGFASIQTKGAVAAKKLIIFSDLLQHSNNLTLYRGIPSAEAFVMSEAYRRLRADLRDVEVSFYLIRRQTRNSIQGPKLIDFWTKVIAAMGGRVVHLKPIEG